MHSRLLTVLSLLLCLTVSGQSQDLQLENLINAALAHNQNLKSVDYEKERSEIIRKQIYHTYIPTLEATGKYAYASGTMNINTDAYGFMTPDIQLPTPTSIGPALAQILGPEQAAAIGAMIGSTIDIPSMPVEVPSIDHSVDFSSRLWQAGLTAKWTLFTGLKVPMLGKAMEHKILAQEHMKAQSEAEVIGQVLYYYDKIAVLVQSEILIKENQTRLDHETKVASRALEEGLITHHDYQKIEIAKLELQSKLVEFNGAKMLLYHKLKQLTAIPTIELEAMNVNLEPLLKTEDGASHLNRPEVLALEEAIIAAEYKAKSEISGYLPKVQAFASHQYMGSSSGELGDFTYSAIDVSPMNVVGIGMKWEIFDGLHTHAERQKSKIDIDQQINKKDEVIELLELNYQNCLSEYNTALAKVALKEKRKDMAKESLDISYKEFQNGLIEISDYIEAQTDYEETVLGYYNTLFDQRQTTVNLMKATGSLKVNSL